MTPKPPSSSSSVTLNLLPSLLQSFQNVILAVHVEESLLLGADGDPEGRTRAKFKRQMKRCLCAWSKELDYKVDLAIEY